jgi:hypothetical protein
MINWLKDEAIYVQCVVHSGIACGIAFGLHFTANQVAAVTCLSAAVLSILTKKAISSN